LPKEKAIPPPRTVSGREGQTLLGNQPAAFDWSKGKGFLQKKRGGFEEERKIAFFQKSASDDTIPPEKEERS